MRTAFARALSELAESDPRVYLLTGDIGHSVWETFRDRFPSRFINVGVAEQNMTGIAAGLALYGKVVFTYSIANFPTFRCLEQIRLDVCLPRANVKIVSVGGGLAYGPLGVSHHNTEDLAVLRALPGMTVLAPADPVETILATRAAVAINGPVYLRLGKVNDPIVHEEPPHFEVGKAILVRPGSATTLIACGGMVYTSLCAAKLLEGRGTKAAVVSMHTVKPLDRKAIEDALDRAPLVFTVEEHSILGGLGGAVAEVMAEVGTKSRLVRIGVPDTFATQVGSQKHLWALYSLTPELIAERVVVEMRRGTS